VLLAEHPSGPREIQWQHLILATGARELFLPFPGWTLPGVMGPGGLQALVKNGWPVSGKRVIVAGSGLLLMAVADGLKKHGTKIISVCEQAPWSQVLGFAPALLAHPSKMLQGAGIKMRLLGVPYRCGVWPVKAMEIQNGNPSGDTSPPLKSAIRNPQSAIHVSLTDGRRTWTEECDLLACGFGLTPNVELPNLLGCLLNNGCVLVNDVQATSLANVFCAGETAGIGGADCALTEGLIAGYAAGGQRDRAAALFKQRASWNAFRAAMAKAFALRPELKNLATDDTLVCRCEDVPLGRVKQFNGWRDAKLQTRCGMGPCQGRVCGGAVKFILDRSMESVRPPVFPVRVSSLISDGQTTTTKKDTHEPQT
jgi:NADPH-dependent 2,4-dienoyl-CoA reductase/sulfur reductase-like enzyme